MNAADRIALARKVGARVAADPAAAGCQDPEAVAAHLLRAAEQRNRTLGLVQDTTEQAAQREAERRERILAVMAQVGR